MYPKFNTSRTIVRVTPEMLSATEIVSSSVVHRSIVDQGRFLKRE